AIAATLPCIVEARDLHAERFESGVGEMATILVLRECARDTAVVRRLVGCRHQPILHWSACTKHQWARGAKRPLLVCECLQLCTMPGRGPQPPAFVPAARNEQQYRMTRELRLGHSEKLPVCRASTVVRADYTEAPFLIFGRHRHLKIQVELKH